MGIAARMKGQGLSEGQAKGINGDLNTAVAAAGTNQATATKLVNSINVVTSVAASSGVILLKTDIGDTQEITNFGTNVLTVYPDSGSRLQGLATNTGMFLGLNTTCLCRRVTATRWTVILSA